MTREEGIRAIDEAKWRLHLPFGVMELSVKVEASKVTAAGSQYSTVFCWIEKRPCYCDRGHVSLKIEGPLGLDFADSFPRYFFSFKEADEHCRKFLKWRVYKESPGLLDWPAREGDAEPEDTP